MQLKPQFKSFKVLESHPITKDDTGNEMCLVCIQANSPHSSCAWGGNEKEIIETVEFWAVLGSRIEKSSNGTLSRSAEAYWKRMELCENHKRDFIRLEIAGFLVEEVLDGTFPYHAVDNMRKRNFTKEEAAFLNFPALEEQFFPQSPMFWPYKTTFKISKISN